MSVFGIHAVADLDASSRARRTARRTRGDRLDDVDALGRGADLAGVEEAGPGGAAHGHVEVGVLEDDERVDAAELEVDALQLLGALTAIRVPTAVEPVKAMQATSGSSTSGSPTSAPVPVTTLTTPGGRSSSAVSHHAQRRQRRQLARLDDDGVAGGDRGRDLPGHEQERIVERHDAADDAERLLDGEVHLVGRHRRDRAAVRVARDLGVVVEAGGAPLDLVEVLDARLAALEREELGEAGAVFAHEAGGLVEELAALDRRHAFASGAERRRRHCDGAAHVLRRGLDDLVDHLERGRVLDGAALRLRAVDPLTVDEEMRVELFHGRRAIYHAAP